MKEKEFGTYLYDSDKRLLYISLSFEDLTKIDECEDYMIINVDEYESTNDNDSIKELIDEILQ